jgi:hypothetical protein
MQRDLEMSSVGGFSPDMEAHTTPLCRRPPLRPNVCSGTGAHSRAGARSYKNQASSNIRRNSASS